MFYTVIFVIYGGYANYRFSLTKYFDFINNTTVVSLLMKKSAKVIMSHAMNAKRGAF